MAVMIEVDEDHVELSDEHDVRVSELSKMFFALMLTVCNETDTNFCALASDLARQMAGNMILNGHNKCAATFKKEVNDTVAFFHEKAKGETAH